MQDDKIKWQAYEYEFFERPADWYWSLGILAAAFALTSAILGNIMFALLIVIAAFSVALHAKKPPEIYNFELSPKGIKINNLLYPYYTLEAFWVEDDPVFDQMIVRSNKKFMPYLVIPLGQNDPAMIREYMLDFLPEEQMREPFTHKLLEYFGL